MIERIFPQKEAEYCMPTQVIFGRGSFLSVLEENIVRSAGKITLILGDHFKKSDNFALLKKRLSDSGKELTIFDSKIDHSDFETINKLTNFIAQVKPDAIIVIGGGTIIDCAKSASILVNNQEKIENYLTGKEKLSEKGIPLIAIPTTAGTGSEVTPWAVVWDYKNNEKFSLSSPLMFPAMAVVDPLLTDGLPSKITAETGMDALTQAIESFWSKSHNSISDNYSLEAIALMMKYLFSAVNFPNNNSRDMVAKASLLSGLAFSNTKTTICHSISYPITIHWGVVHGQAVSVSLPLMIKYSLICLEEKRREALLLAIGAKTVEKASEKIEELIKSIGLKTKLSELGITEKDIDTIVNEGYNPDRMNNAPKVPTHSELKKLLKRIL